MLKIWIELEGVYFITNNGLATSFKNENLIFYTKEI
jgi:hypothetical protein